jgi:hypothetical protein
VDSRLFAEAVVASFGASAARADIETRGDDAVAVIEPSNAGACSLRVTYQPERELVALLLGEDEVLVELSLTGPVEWPDVQPWIAPRAQAVFDGRYEQVRTTLRDGTLVAVVGTFHLEDGDVRHVYRRRLGWFRRKQRSRITFAAYG